MTETPPRDARAFEPWASLAQPGDAPKRHVLDITRARHEYTVSQSGALDGDNCRNPDLGWMPGKQVWESNRAVRLENVGEADVINPWLSNGRNNFRSIDEMVASAVAPGMTDAEKARALWYQQTSHRCHFTPGDREVKNPVKTLNVYGQNTCGDDANCLAGLWRVAGFKVAPARLWGHCISQVFYDGAWHLLDSDEACLYLMRDNRTVAGGRDVARDHDLIKRCHVGGVSYPHDPVHSQKEAAEFIYDGDTFGTRDAIGTHTMDMTLRPGEAIVWRWGHADPLKYHGNSAPRYPLVVCNGLWEYRPDLASALWRTGARSVENVLSTPEGLVPAPNASGAIVWTMKSPYVFVGGCIEFDAPGARFSLSWDGLVWTPIASDLDALFPSAGPARYKYLLKCDLPAGATLRSLAIVNDIQMTPLTEPGMRVGANRFLYTDATPGPRNVRITHEWVERSSTRPPEAPAAPLYPLDGGESDGTDFVFRWTESAHPVGAIVDYHFSLSDRPDMRWPLSPTLYRMISLTPDQGKAQFTLPLPGMLTPDSQYYWRVRARDAQGVWGPWSRTWSFTARGVAHPVDVRMDFDPVRGVGALRWKPNPVGRKPASYRIYGSDEKGFSVSDVPYDVLVDSRPEKSIARFPANFVAETAKTEFDVVGRGLDFPNANRAYYRVVAADANGKRSWSSDYVESPRPFVYTTPVLNAVVGREYIYSVGAIRSLGDLRYRVAHAMFWDEEHPRYTLDRAPSWLTLDPDTGRLTGTPTLAGRTEVEVSVVIDKDVPRINLRLLPWGRVRIDGTETHRVGKTNQTFVIEVRNP